MKAHPKSMHQCFECSNFYWLFLECNFLLLEEINSTVQPYITYKGVCPYCGTRYHLRINVLQRTKKTFEELDVIRNKTS